MERKYIRILGVSWSPTKLQSLYLDLFIENTWKNCNRAYVKYEVTSKWLIQLQLLTLIGIKKLFHGDGERGKKKLWNDDENFMLRVMTVQWRRVIVLPRIKGSRYPATYHNWGAWLVWDKAPVREKKQSQTLKQKQTLNNRRLLLGFDQIITSQKTLGTFFLDRWYFVFDVVQIGPENGPKDPLKLSQ
jgi:hypothetical protein